MDRHRTIPSSGEVSIGRAFVVAWVVIAAGCGAGQSGRAGDAEPPPHSPWWLTLSPS
jgi:hypothetical protein